MPPADDALLLCRIPADLLDELDTLARDERTDRAALAAKLLAEALRVRTIARSVESATRVPEAIPFEVIPFPRPAWAVDFEDEA